MECGHVEGGAAVVGRAEGLEAVREEEEDHGERATAHGH